MRVHVIIVTVAALLLWGLAAGLSFPLQRRVNKQSTPARLHRVLMKYAPKNYSASHVLVSDREATVALRAAHVDVEYIGEMQVGTPPQNFYMDFDTGSADTWIPSTQCTRCSTPRFDAAKSSSFRNTTKDTWTLQYGDGSGVQGYSGYETIRVGNVTVPDTLLGFATKESADFAADDALDGIFGLGFPDLSFVDAGKLTIVQRMAQLGLIERPIFGVWLGGSEDGGRGELTFGETNPAHYEGDLRYLKVARERYWEIEFGGLRVENHTLRSNTSGSTGATNAILDTGTTLIVVPPSLSRAIHEAVPGAIYNASLGWSVPCDMAHPPVIDFMLGEDEASFPVKFTDLIRERAHLVNDSLCYSGVAESPTSLIILGDAFLKNFYAVFDYEQSRIGLARSKP